MSRPIRPTNPPILALQTPGGLTFGRAHEVAIDRLVFDLDSRLLVGEELSWRLELVGWQETVMGSLRIDRRADKGVDNLPVFHASILSMSANDRQMFEDWLNDQAHGGSSRRALRSITPNSAGGRKHSANENPARQVVDDHGQRGVRQSTGPGTPSTVTRDPFGLTTERPSDMPLGSGRENFRKALRAGLRRASSTMPPQSDTFEIESNAGLNDSAPSQSPRPAAGPPGRPATSKPTPPAHPDLASRGSPKPPPPVAPVRSSATSSSPSLDPLEDDDVIVDDAEQDAGPAKPKTTTPTPLSNGESSAPEEARIEPRAATPPGADPAIEYVPFTVPPLVRVTYTSEDAYRRDWRQHIRGAGLFLPVEDIAILYLDIRVHIVLPSGTDIEVPARVVAPLAGGCGVMLDIDMPTKRLLEDEAAT